MRILKETIFEEGTKITTYESPDNSIPLCGKCCLIDAIIEKCSHCGKSLNLPEEKENNTIPERFVYVENEKKGLKSGCSYCLHLSHTAWNVSSSKTRETPDA